MEKKTGNARHLARRLHVRRGIPSYVELPKFMTPGEIELVITLKKERPQSLWEDVVREVIMRSFDTTKEKDSDELL